MHANICKYVKMQIVDSNFQNINILYSYFVMRCDLTEDD